MNAEPGFSDWAPITPPSAAEVAYSSHATRQLEELGRAWQARRAGLEASNPEELQIFLDRLVRAWAIETGVLENAYEVSEGATQTLIEQGLVADFIGREDTNIPPDDLVQQLRDHVAAATLVYDLVSENRQLTPFVIRELHQLLTRRQDHVDAETERGERVRVPMLHGEFKRLPNNPKRDDGSIHVYAPPEQVEGEINRLIDFHAIHGDGPPAHVAAWLHHRFTQIHPFQDGNGRVARALTNAVFIKADLFPLLVHRRRRAQYLVALEVGDQGDLRPLIDLFAEIEAETLLQAMSLSQQPDIADQSVEGVVDQVVTRLATRLKDRMSDYRSVNSVAAALRDAGLDHVLGLANRAAAQLEPAGLRLRTTQTRGGLDFGTEHWWKNALIDAGRSERYWVNFQEGQFWFEVKLGNAPIDFHFIVSLHHVGREITGIMRALAFAEFDVEPGIGYRRDGEGQERVRRTCSVQPFTVTWQSALEDLSPAFMSWLEEAYAVALRNWLDLF